MFKTYRMISKLWLVFQNGTISQENLSMGFLTSIDTNRAQYIFPQEIIRDFETLNLEVLFYLQVCRAVCL